MLLTLRRRIFYSYVIQHMDRSTEYIDIMKRYLRPLRPLPAGLKREGNLKRIIHAVLFDIYGTLFISVSGDVQEAKDRINIVKLDTLLKSYSIEIEASEVLKRYFGEIERIHSHLKGEGIDFPEVEIDRIWMKVLEVDDLTVIRRFAVEYEALFNPVWPMPFLEELLKSLKEDGIIMGIISNAQFFTGLLFELFLGSPSWELGFHEELIFYSFEYKYAKPSPALYNKAKLLLGKKGIDPGNTLYVGNDMLNDICPAYNAGFQTALFAGDRRSLRLRKDDERCTDISPDLIITNLKELSEYISNMSN